VTDEVRRSLRDALGGAYVLERELIGGGMSRVFLATETALGRKVVVKVLPREMSGQLSVGRFKREIALAAQLQHPRIVPLLTAGDVGDLPHFTMPFIKGESLRARLVKEGELPVAEAVRILREVASALDYAHEADVVHRDIKPDNVLLSGGSAMVTDFGVAKALSASATQGGGQITSLGVAIGTPAYMAPEQASADPMVDHRADVYAWGVLAYEVLTGNPPFAGRSAAALLAAHVTEAPEPVTRRRPSIPPALGALVMRCLEKRPADRPQSAAEVVRALDVVTTPSGGIAPTSSGIPAVPPPRGGGRRAWITAALVVVAAGSVFAWQRLHRGPGAEAEARKVLATDSSNSDAWSMAASITGQYVWDWPRSRAEAARARALNPEDALAGMSDSWFLLAHGQIDSALVLQRRALEVDPLSALQLFLMQLDMIAKGQYDSAYAYAQRIDSPYPGFAYLDDMGGYELALLGRWDEAERSFRASESRLGHRSPGLTWLLATRGRNAEARAVLADIERDWDSHYVAPEFVACAYAALGDMDTAFGWLDRGLDVHSVAAPFMVWFPGAEPLRDDPRFREVLERLNLDTPS